MHTRKTTGQAGGEVEVFMQALSYPLKPVVQAVRTLVLGVDPAIGEAIKWNAPSFHLHEHFATLHLRDPSQVQVILHFGAKKRAGAAVHVDDPTQLLTWLGPERASVRFTDVVQLRARHAAFVAILRQWIGQL